MAEEKPQASSVPFTYVMEVRWHLNAAVAATTRVTRLFCSCGSWFSSYKGSNSGAGMNASSYSGVYDSGELTGRSGFGTAEDGDCYKVGKMAG